MIDLFERVSSQGEAFAHLREIDRDGGGEREVDLVAFGQAEVGVSEIEDAIGGLVCRAPCDRATAANVPKDCAAETSEAAPTIAGL